MCKGLLIHNLLCFEFVELTLNPNRSLENFAFILSENSRYMAIIMSEAICFLQQMTVIHNTLLSKISNDRFGLNISVYDTKTEYSFLYHIPGTDRHSRKEKNNGRNNSTLPFLNSYGKSKRTNWQLTNFTYEKINLFYFNNIIMWL